MVLFVCHLIADCSYDYLSERFFRWLTAPFGPVGDHGGDGVVHVGLDTEIRVKLPGAELRLRKAALMHGRKLRD